MVSAGQATAGAPGGAAFEPGLRLVARGISFAYPESPALIEGLSIELAAGELYCLIGPNGAGKSTLQRLLAGSLEPRAGRVELSGGRTLGGLGPRARAKEISVVPQSLVRIPDWTVEDFVASGRYAHIAPFQRPGAKDRAQVEAALAQCDLLGLEARPLSELSGGQRQRALLARAFVQDAAVWLIDEPTSSLDLPHQLATFELIASLTCQGRAVLTVTHDLNLASQFATRVGLLVAGQLVAEGPPEAVLTREVLEPVYGPDLYFGRLPAAVGTGRPFVLPKRAH